VLAPPGPIAPDGDWGLRARQQRARRRHHTGTGARRADIDGNQKG
jgi:hypothetical protein